MRTPPPATTKPVIANEDTPRGLIFALSAYVLWGFLPLYLKALTHVPVLEVIAHRVIWSVPIAGIVLIAMGRTGDIGPALRNPRMLIMACVTAVLVSINWGVYIFAIVTDRAADGALGYYINPLFSMFLGAVLLGERMTRPQLVAVGLAALAVVILFLDASRPPWIPLGLTVSWGLYAYFKKSLPVGPNQGFLLEVLILSVPALAFLGWLSLQGQSSFLLDGTTTLLLIGCGLITAVPLLFYANGAKLTKLSTIAILQYLTPTMILAQAVFVFGEELDRARMIAFPLIWAALLIYTVSLVRGMRKA
ncbi:EamA family transporter RarD [Thalassorhabdomicrobium marinisediminis]|uniref:EamA family transporter RarD n=1 Tax=Thalassorhabdomicrobium marinisediminis TaxID=2170577 RepID=A0A2T7G0B6_9RHOB|nr:EamA family transporter RarD [Thalassorhabdomicrobium marinisediminis]PVA07845.1 EamA family transporter RarD [Thalassorhabdomicrobium marinisediminis]